MKGAFLAPLFLGVPKIRYNYEKPLHRRLKSTTLKGLNMNSPRWNLGFQNIKKCILGIPRATPGCTWGYSYSTPSGLCSLIQLTVS